MAGRLALGRFRRAEDAFCFELLSASETASSVQAMPPQIFSRREIFTEERFDIRQAFAIASSANRRKSPAAVE